MVAGFATPSLAYDFGNGLTLVGDVELEYLMPESGNDSGFGFTDVTLGWRAQSGFGFDLTGVSAHFLDAGQNFSRIYGGLVFTTSFGEITLGSPRPLLDILSPAPDVGASRALTLEFGQLNGSFLAGVALFQSDSDPYGISLKGRSGNLSYGAAVHRADFVGTSAEFFELTGSYDMGQTRLYAGIELGSIGPTDLENVMLGALYKADRWSVGAEASLVSSGGAELESFLA
jgi:hypothetical protein